MSEEWTNAQRAFSIIWPTVVVYCIGKLLVEKMWNKKEAIKKFETDREKNFSNFTSLSDPSSNVNNPKIVGGDNSTKESIEEIFETILKLNLESLRQSLQNDKYNCYTVLCAFIWRAMKIQRTINCITEVIKEAFDTAEHLDEKYYKTSEPKGQLHGLPFSVKSNFHVEGYDVTIGLAKLLAQPKTSTTPFVLFLKEQGAVPFCLTNVPQGLLSYVSSNPLYGTTKNPWNFERTPGGSSGGEAALLAAGGSAFGIGSDLAGSLRIPAAFCGLVTLKPTQERFVVTETHGGLPGRGRLGLSFGFYTRRVSEQEYLLKLIIGNPEYRKWCPESSKAPLIEQEIRGSDKKPIIGFYVNDGFNPVVPSNKRAVEETIQKMRNLGYDCREFKWEEVGDAFEIADMLFRNVMPDNGEYMAEMYAGESYDTHMAMFIRLIGLKQNMIVKGLFRALSPFTRMLSKRLAALAGARNGGLGDQRQNQENTDNFKLKFNKYWRELGIDALIAPSFITPAQKFDFPAELSTGAYITGLFNMLDVPAGVVPIGHVTAEDDKELELFDTEGDVLLGKQKASVENSVGLPNSVQVVTLPNEEETCLRVMRIVEGTATGVKSLQWAENPQGDQNESSSFFERIDLEYL